MSCVDARGKILNIGDIVAVLLGGTYNKRAKVPYLKIENINCSVIPTYYTLSFENHPKLIRNSNQVLKLEQ